MTRYGVYEKKKTGLLKKKQNCMRTFRTKEKAENHAIKLGDSPRTFVSKDKKGEMVKTIEIRNYVVIAIE